MESTKEEVSIYRNPPQLNAYLMNCPMEVHIMGRGTGKSSGILADKSENWVFDMPTSCIANIAASYQQHLTRTLPALVDGWEKKGYKENVDFFIGKYAPKSWGWKQPKRRPINQNYTIHWRSGSIIQLLSQDVKGSSNGMDIDALMGDEAKYLKQEQLDSETRPAMRGNKELFSYNPANGIHHTWHHNTCFTTDMPTSAESMWLLDYENKMDTDRCDAIKYYSYLLESYRFKLYHTKSESSAKRLRSQINGLWRTLKKLRKGDPLKGVNEAIYFQEASSLSNLDILGPEYFTRELQNMGYEEFKISILNHRVNKSSTSFYPKLSEKLHGYEAYNNEFLNTVDYKTYKEDCRQDADLIPDMPLHMAGDFGGSFNGFLIGQPAGKRINAIKGIHSLYPKLLSDALYEFKRYYRHHPNKYIYLYYDHTHYGSTGLSSDNYKSTCIDILTKADEYGAWKINDIYIGKTPSYSSRYELWNNLLTGKNSSGLTFRFNRFNCSSWKDSCLLAGMKNSIKGTEKDKSSEKKFSGEKKWRTPQDKATHYSDAGDVLIEGIINHHLKSKSKSFAVV